jgi:hypothetical protein
MVPARSVSACSRWFFAICLVASLTACVHGSNREQPASVLEIATVTTDADVWVDGEYIGQVSAVSGKLRLAPGVHRVEIRKPGHFPVQRTVEVDKQGGTAVVVEAELLADPR